MTLSDKARKIYAQISNEKTKLGDLRLLAKQIKKDHQLAKELWATEEFFPRLMAILIMDVKALDPQSVAILFEDIANHQYEERLQLADWLMANQLTKDKKTIAQIQSWENDSSSLKRRLFWYYQGRLRWMGKTPQDNTGELLSAIEERILNEVPEVQWAMNFTAGWIGVFDKNYRSHCIKMGEKLGLYKDKIVPRNCSPDYLPAFIDMEVIKRGL